MSSSGQSKLDGAFFQYDQPSNEWTTFEAEGFSAPVTGVVYRTGTTERGVPLGGIGTNYMHLGTDGLLDYNNAFNFYFRTEARRRVRQPFFGLTVGEAAWILSLPEELTKAVAGAIEDPRVTAGYGETESRVEHARELHYWGHYPVADMEYETTAPVRVGVRAWTPFVLGDSEASNTPGSVFEVRVRNTSQTAQHGSVIVSFPGWIEHDALLGTRGNTGLRGGVQYQRQTLQRDLHGVHVSFSEPGHEIGYALGVVGQRPARAGGALGWNTAAWARAHAALPEVDASDPGTSLAAEFHLEAGQSETLRFVLAWYAPFWRAEYGQSVGWYVGWYGNRDRPYVHKYHDRFKSAAEVGRYLAGEHGSLLKRILGWQGALYATDALPGWMQDSLINNFHIIAQNSFWAYSGQSDHWAGREGLFGMNESLRSCAQFCVACDWIGNFPVVLFFPDLALRHLEALTHWQKEDGEVAFSLGGGTELDSPYYGVQYSTDSQHYVKLVARMWQRTGDVATLRRFYPAVKKAVRFLQGMDEDGDSIVDTFGASWCYEGFPAKGAAVYVAGLWLATLRIAGRMAQEMGDHEFVEECQSWLVRAGESLENTLWDEQSASYLLYHQPATGWKSDVVLSDQLVGECETYLHGVSGVFPPERVRQAQETVWRICVEGSLAGARSTMYPNRSPYQGGYISAYGTLYPAMLRMYTGDKEAGVDLARRMWQAIIRKGYPWDHPSHIQWDGDRMSGHEYYHNTLLWAVPVAVLGQDLGEFCAAGGAALTVGAADAGRHPWARTDALCVQPRATRPRGASILDIPAPSPGNARGLRPPSTVPIEGAPMAQLLDEPEEEPFRRPGSNLEVISTGNSEIDKKMGGGIPKGSMTLIEGESDSGKSVLSQQMIWGSLYDGFDVTLYTSENTFKSFIKQMTSLSLDVSDFVLLRKLKIFTIKASKSDITPEMALNILLASIQEYVNPTLVVVDSLTTFITHTSIEETMTYFEACKASCDVGTTIVNIVNSYAFGEAELSRVRSMCDAHLKLRTEQVGDIMVKVLVVAKVRGADMSTGNVVSFDVEPMLGMRIIPISKVNV